MKLTINNSQLFLRLFHQLIDVFQVLCSISQHLQSLRVRLFGYVTDIADLLVGEVPFAYFREWLLYNGN